MTWQTDPPIFPDKKSYFMAAFLIAAVAALLLISRSAF